jgi:polysaccharide export outer membrane protein
MTVRKAISLAGGFTERASERGISVIREGQTDRSKGSKVDLGAAIGPGDILTVDESFF